MADTSRKITVKFDGDAGKLKAATATSARELDKFRDEVEKTDHSIGVTSKGTKSLALEMGNLSREVEESTNRLRALQRLRAQTGDDSFFVDIRKEQSNLRRLKRLMADLSEEASKAGAESGRHFLGSMAAVFQGTAGTPVLGPILVGVLLGVLPALTGVATSIGAMIGGAITAGLGAGFLAVGIIGAARDSRVKAAAKSFGETVMEEITAAGRPFIEPLIRAFEKFKVTFRSLGLAAELAKLAPVVDRVVDGITALVRNAWPGFKKALAQAGPALVIVSDGLAKIGTALGEAMANISESEGTLMGLKVLFDVIAGSIKAFGVVVEWLGNTFRWFIQRGHDLASFMANLADATFQDEAAAKWRRVADGLLEIEGSGGKARAEFERLRGAAPPAGGAIAQVGAQAKIAGQKVDILNGELSTLFGQMMSLDRAKIAAKQALADVTAAIKENGTSLSLNTQAGRDNRTAILNAIEAFKAQMDAYVARTGDVEGATATFNDQVAALREIATKAGISKTALDELAKKYYIDIITRESIIRQGQTETDREGRRAYRAHGGSVRPYWTYEVAEQGPELLTVGQRQYLMMGAQGGSVTSSDAMRAQGSDQPIIVENHIEIGGEVVRVVRTEVNQYARDVRRGVLAGAGAR